MTCGISWPTRYVRPNCVYSNLNLSLLFEERVRVILRITTVYLIFQRTNASEDNVGTKWSQLRRRCDKYKCRNRLCHASYFCEVSNNLNKLPCSTDKLIRASKVNIQDQYNQNLHRKTSINIQFANTFHFSQDASTFGALTCFVMAELPILL